MDMPVRRDERLGLPFISGLSRIPRIWIILSLAIVAWAAVLGLWMAGQLALSALPA